MRLYILYTEERRHLEVYGPVGRNVLLERQYTLSEIHRLVVTQRSAEGA